MPLAEMVARHVVVCGDCLVWTGRRHMGYGTLPWRGRPADQIMVARLLWQERHGPVPEGRRLRNACGNRACVRTDHWEVRGMAGTPYRAKITVEYMIDLPDHLDSRLLQTLVAGQLLERGLPVVDQRHPVGRRLVAGKPEPLLLVGVQSSGLDAVEQFCMFNTTTGKRRLVWQERRK